MKYKFISVLLNPIIFFDRKLNHDIFLLFRRQNDGPFDMPILWLIPLIYAILWYKLTRRSFIGKATLQIWNSDSKFFLDISFGNES